MDYFGHASRERRQNEDAHRTLLRQVVELFRELKGLQDIPSGISPQNKGRPVTRESLRVAL
jgi:hypothetical protein